MKFGIGISFTSTQRLYNSPTYCSIDRKKTNLDEDDIIKIELESWILLDLLVKTIHLLKKVLLFQKPKYLRVGHRLPVQSFFHVRATVLRGVFLE